MKEQFHHGRRILVLICLYGVLSSMNATASERWPMFRNNPLHTGQSANLGPTTNALKWAVDVSSSASSGNFLCSSPAVDTSGVIYIGGGSLKAFYPNGSLKWEFNPGAGAFMSSPAIDSNGAVYAADLAGRLYAIDQTGKEMTRDATGSAIYSSPVITSDGMIYIGSYDGKIHAVQPNYTTNVLSELWTYQTAGNVTSSPAVGADGTVYVGSTDGFFYALNPATGTIKWKYSSSGVTTIDTAATATDFPTNLTYSSSGVSTLGAINSSPAVDGSGNIYFGTDHMVAALDSNGNNKWNFTPTVASSFDASPGISPDGYEVYVGARSATGGALYALYASDGSVKWSYPCGGVLSSPAIGADGLIYFADTNGKIIALNPDGTEKWTFDSGLATSSSPAIGSNKTLYIGSYCSFLGAFGPPSTYIQLPAASATTPVVNAYRIIGIPVLPSDTDTFNTLAGFWGSGYQPGLWRVYAYTGGAYTEITGSGKDYINYGKGWLIISKDAKELEISGTPLTADFSISVASGYNLVACPFQDKSVTWQSVVNDSSNTFLTLGSTLYDWDGSGNFVAATTMYPGKAYFAWVGNSTGGTLSIKRTTAASQQTEAAAPRGVSGNQPPPPAGPGALINIVSPDSHATWIAGNIFPIRWKSSGITPEGFADTVSIALSTDSGDTYQILENGYSDSGRYDWHIPSDAASNHCRIKVTSSLYPGISGISDVFTIRQ